MNKRELCIDWVSSMKKAGVYTDSKILNEVVYNDVNVEQKDKNRVFNQIDNDILMMADEEEVKKFFKNIFSSEHLINYFSSGLGMYVDLTKQGDVLIARDIDVENLTLKEIKLALVELFGKDKVANLMTIQKEEEMRRRVIIEIKIRLTLHFKPLAEFSAKKYKDFEEAMTN
ncbi:hypothetical protein [Priestia aryabhattai]